MADELPFSPEQIEGIFRSFENKLAHQRINVMKTVLPVGARKPGTQELTRPDFFGTAFAVDRDVFITAAHVIKSALEDGEPVICGGASNGLIGGAFIDDYELLEDIDIAIVRTKTKPDVTILANWQADRVQVLTDLITFGYPYAVTLDHLNEHRYNAVFRAFKGSVVVVRAWDRIPNASPAIYEVSTQFPVGTSGAPILWGHDGKLVVVGVVLGTQTVTYDGVATHAGIGLIADQLLRRESRLLGGMFAEKLKLNGFLVGRTPA